jgi:hypothetical protein
VGRTSAAGVDRTYREQRRTLTRTQPEVCTGALPLLLLLLLLLCASSAFVRVSVAFGSCASSLPSSLDPSPTSSKSPSSFSSSSFSCSSDASVWSWRLRLAAGAARAGCVSGGGLLAFVCGRRSGLRPHVLCCMWCLNVTGARLGSGLVML